MFCSNCGAQIPEGGKFCSGCGQAINADGTVTPVVQAPAVDNMIAFQAQKNALRQSEIGALENTLAHFNQKRTEFEEYDLVCELVNDFSRGAKSALLVWGIIIVSCGLLGLLGVLSEGVMEGVLGVLLAFILPGAAMMVGGILMKVNSAKKKAYFEAEYARLSQELYDHYVAYPNCPVGPEYVNPEILELILSTLISGRADTIKESINLLIAEANQAEVNAYLESIEAQTASINANTRVAAVFAAANFFK